MAEERENSRVESADLGFSNSRRKEKKREEKRRGEGKEGFLLATWGPP